MVISDRMNGWDMAIDETNPDAIGTETDPTYRLESLTAVPTVVSSA